MTLSVRPGDSPTATIVSVGEYEFLFSIVAFLPPRGGWVVSENAWSRTTGRHMMDATHVQPKDRIPYGDFRQRLDAIHAGITVAP